VLICRRGRAKSCSPPLGNGPAFAGLRLWWGAAVRLSGDLPVEDAVLHNDSLTANPGCHADYMGSRFFRAVTFD